MLVISDRGVAREIGFRIRTLGSDEVLHLHSIDMTAGDVSSHGNLSATLRVGHGYRPTRRGPWICVNGSGSLGD